MNHKLINRTRGQLSNLLEHLKNKRFRDAEKLANSVTKEFPNNQFAWKALWAALQKNGKILASLTAIKKSVQLSPRDPQVHYNLGITFQKLESFKEAETSFKKAIDLKPNYYLAHYSLGINFKKLAQLDNAASCLRTVIKLNSDYYLANYNLGVILSKQRKFKEAEAFLIKAIELKPNDFKAYNNLGNVLTEVGRLGEACYAFIKVIDINKEFFYAYENLGAVLKKIRFKSSDTRLYPALINFLKFGKSVRPKDVAVSILTLLKHDPAMKGLLADKNIDSNLDKITFNIEVLNKFELLHYLMRICPLADLDLEKLFLKIRRFLIVNIDSLGNSPALDYFLSTLSLQCFINEYVYFESEEETKLVNKLEMVIAATIKRSKQPDVFKILCLASYRPLHTYNWCQSLKVLNHLEEIKKRLIEEPLFEKALSRNIVELGAISDNVSNRVKMQYEENPYPRWVKLALPTKEMSIAEFCKTSKLQLYSNNIKGVTAPNILVAGCGTGQHSIETASRFLECQVTAIDLSLASLAYAKRKTIETKINNLKYIQADILNLAHMDEKFDIIESVGVLHHMSKPMAGWEVLTKMIKPSGLMRIGLYSELARQDIVKTRNEIKLLNVGTSEDEMRNFRRTMIDSSKESHQRLTKSDDFFSLSTLRDLIFHIQEHRFTLPQIARCLEDLGLFFCGFGDKDIVSKFMAFHGEEANIYDLNLWHRYEENNPNTFVGMYQFWCQKL